MLRFILYDDEAKVYSDDFEGTVVIGRQDAEKHEPSPFARLKLENDTWKVIFASSHEKVWSRKQIIFEPSQGGTKIKVTNGGSERRFQLEDGRAVPPGVTCEVPLPAVVNLGGSKVVRVQTASGLLGSAPAGGSLMGGLPNVTLPPHGTEAPQFLPSLAGLSPDIDQKEIIAWLNAVTDVLQAAVGSDQFFDRAAESAVQMVELDSAGVLLYHGGEWHSQVVKLAHPGVPETRTPSQAVLNRVLQERRTFWEVLEGDQDRKTSLTGVTAVVAAPVLDREGQVIGVLYGERLRALSLVAQPITEAEAMLVELLARGVAAGLARQAPEQAALALQKELDIGREIQRTFLPVKANLPQLAHWEIEGRFQPAKLVSGDFYDVFPISACHFGVVIADVCNKGVGAALFMALFRSLIRAFSQHGIARDLTGCMANQQSGSSSPGDRNLTTLLIELNLLTTVALTNNYVANVHSDAYMFATIFLGVLDTTTGIVHYINAGHDAPIHLGANGIKGRLVTTGPAVGFQADQQYNLQTVLLEPGDLLFCYTDGLPDARSPSGISFNEKRVLELVNRPFNSVAQILDLVESSANAHTGGGPPFDDLTLLAIYRTPTTGQS